MKTIDNLEQVTGGAVGPHSAYGLPGRVLIPCLSNAKDEDSRTALASFSNEGDCIVTHWLLPFDLGDEKTIEQAQENRRNLTPERLPHRSPVP